MRKTFLLFLIISIEGYIVLACELLAIRQLIPFVGSGIEITAIVISAVLLPLALGYHAGGRAFIAGYSLRRRRGRRSVTVRRLLMSNILFSLVILCIGLSYFTLDIFIRALFDLGLRNYTIQAVLYSLLFLVTPMYLLGQTVPLTSNYFSQHRLSEITGKMLFFSTSGAFLGSLLSTLLFMTFFGVHNTVIITLALLALLSVIIGGLKRWRFSVACWLIVGFAMIINHGGFLRSYYHMVADNPYNTVSIVNSKEDHSSVMIINGSFSSTWNQDPEKRAQYIVYIDKHFIEPLLKDRQTPRDILVIGAGGFVVGYDDTFNHYTFVDIDRELKDVAENHFLPGKLAPNKKFVATSARAFVHNDAGQYDLIIVDVFTMRYSIPMECTTREFLLDVKSRLKRRGILAINVITSPYFSDKFSVRYDRTFSSVFPVHTRQVFQSFNPWTYDSTVPSYANVLYVYYHNELADDEAYYTDDKNTYSLDQPQNMAYF